jgi:hypothetical protein
MVEKSVKPIIKLLINWKGTATKPPVDVKCIL